MLTAALGGCVVADDDDSDSGAATSAPGESTGGGTIAPGTEGSTGPDGSSDAGSTGPGADTSTGEGTDGTGDGPLQWTEGAGPCPGSETSAMWFDDRDRGFVGCGENASGEGLFVTIDGGLTWEAQSAFGEVRTMDLRRGPDGVLYGAGTDQLDGFSMWSIDESGAEAELVGMYTPSNSAFTAVGQGENAAVTAAGAVLVDSLTGTQAAHRPAGGAFEEHYSLGEAAIEDPDNAPAFQVRRIVAQGEDFFAVGSLINDPARVHLPSMLPGATFHFQTVLLQPENRDGELLDMHVWSPTRMIVAGYDQSERYPLIYVVDGDPYGAANWQKIELADFGFEDQAGIDDLDVVGDTVVAVGSKIPTASGGFVVRSEDGGLTWEDMTPVPASGVPGAFSAVELFEDGSMIVAGGGGELWHYGAP